MASIVVAGCAHERVLAVGRHYSLRVVAGDGQSAPAGSALATPLTVEVRDAAGGPVKAAVVIYRIFSGAASGAAMDDSIAVTDAAGRAAGTLRLGSQSGTVTVRVYPLGAPERGISMTATATAGPAITGVLPYAVGPGDTLSIAGSALGGTQAMVQVGTALVRPVSGSASLLRVIVPDCLPPGELDVRVRSGSAWTGTSRVVYTARRRTLSLRAYEGTVVPAATVSSCLQLAADSGAEYVLVPQFAARASTPTAAMARVSASVGGAQAMLAPFGEHAPSLRGLPVWSAQSALDAMLRDEERRLAPLARDGASYVPPMPATTPGGRRAFWVQTTLDGSAYDRVTGALRWLGDHVGIYVDTAAATAYTDEEVAQLGRLFDRELYATATTTFGAESDIDKNGRVLVFMTPRVNALVAAADCAQRGFVTGYFSGRDLLPATSHSNAAEMLYAMVPDSTARYSCAHTKRDATRLLSGTFVHEMQHMISFFQHVLARGGEAEEPWLNEGLSHIAEEAVSRLYEARFPPPSGRSTPEQIFPDSAQAFITPQLLNSYVYLNSTANHSVTTYEGAGSLEERGAAWLFLRWLGDHKGEAIFGRLVQSPRRGVANVEQAAGESFAALFGDFTLAVWGDSLVGVPRDRVPERYRFLSRNLRQLMARQALIAGWPDPFPVKPVRIPVGGYAEGPLVPGTMVYGTLGSLAAGQALLTLSFARQDGSAFGAADGAQLGILRVR